MKLSLKEIPLVILCGGKSSRMGEDKALLPFSSHKTLVQYQYERLKPYFKHVYLSSKVDKFEFECDIIYDDKEVSSPLVALQTILNEIKTPKVFILTVDTPFVELKTMNSLYLQSKGFDITVAQTKKIHNLCGVFDKTILNKINEMVEDDFHKVGALLKKVNTSYLTFENEDEFINLNTPLEYQQATDLIQS